MTEKKDSFEVSNTQQNEALRALDDVIVNATSALHRSKTGECLDYLATFSSVALSALAESTDFRLDSVQRAVDTLFDSRLTHKQRRFISACLLRLLASSQECFDSPSFRVEAYRLFDDVLNDTVYKALKIDRKDQTYHKEQKLRSLVSDVEEQVQVLWAGASTVESVPAMLQQLIKTLKSPVAMTVLVPFLPPGLLDVKLAELRRSIEQYVDESAPKSLATLNRARDGLANFISDAGEFGTIYSRKYAEEPARRLLDLLTTDFENSPFSKPATVVLRPTEKRYPLSEVGGRFDLNVVLGNQGPGYAHEITVRIKDATDVRSEGMTHEIQTMPPGEQILSFPVQLESTTSDLIADFHVEWTNHDGSTASRTDALDFGAQRADLDWESLHRIEPYSLEPVTTERELVGRGKVFDRLVALVRPSGVGSAYVYGQKRVGKTSLVKTLQTHVESGHDFECLVVYLETGDYRRQDANGTINALGARLCRRIAAKDPRFNILGVPEFHDSLDPLSEFLDTVQDIAPRYRVLFVLDEFDELPLDLLRRGDAGDSLFLTLRSISNKPNFGFILVGGEKMDYVISSQGDRLNKFVQIRLDYFDKANHWSDFSELVRQPVEGWFQIHDAALEAAYHQTAGHPYFTKQICAEMFAQQVDRRDCDVTQQEMEEAVASKVQSVGNEAFQHFWEDGIVAPTGEAEDIRMQRRKVIVSVGEVSQRQSGITRDAVVEQAQVHQVDEATVLGTLRDYDRRQVLTITGDEICFKVPFFELWLRERGAHQIITSSLDPASISAWKTREERLRVRPEEIVSLAGDWSLFRGRVLTPTDIQAWIDQFPQIAAQRLMFTLLQGIRFYSNASIRKKMAEAYQHVGGRLTRSLEGGQPPSLRTKRCCSFSIAPPRQTRASLRLRRACGPQPESAAVSTACHWQSSWLRLACACSPRRSCSSAFPGDYRSWWADPETILPGCRRCETPLTGATRCSRRRSRCYLLASPFSPAETHCRLPRQYVTPAAISTWSKRLRASSRRICCASSRETAGAAKHGISCSKRFASTRQRSSPSEER